MTKKKTAQDQGHKTDWVSNEPSGYKKPPSLPYPGLDETETELENIPGDDVIEYGKRPKKT